MPPTFVNAALSKSELTLSKREIPVSWPSLSVLAQHLGWLYVRHWCGARANNWETSNDLEDPENCRSAGRHGNQHVRLRSAQVDSIKAICPAPTARSLSRAGQACAPINPMAPRPADLPRKITVPRCPQILPQTAFRWVDYDQRRAMAHDPASGCAKLPSGQLRWRFRRSYGSGLNV